MEIQQRDTVQHDLAQKIWDIPFASTNLHKLKKKELLILIDEMLYKIATDYEGDWFEEDVKDVLFNQKCWLIEALDPHFFDNTTKE